jgi:hypothetical protein
MVHIKFPLKRFTTQRKGFAVSCWSSYAFETRLEGLRRDRRRAEVWSARQTRPVRILMVHN